MDSKLLARLAQTRHADVRLKVAGDSRTPAAALVALADDDDALVRQAVLADRQMARLSPVDLAQIATLQFREMRKAVAARANTPASALIKLSQDDTEDVRRTACGTLGVHSGVSATQLAECAASSWYTLRWAAGRHTGTPAALLDKLATDENESVRAIIAWNPNTPAATLARMTGDASLTVRLNLAANVNAPAASLLKLAQDTSPEVVDKALNTIAREPLGVTSHHYAIEAEQGSACVSAWLALCGSREQAAGSTSAPAATNGNPSAATTVTGGISWR